MIKRGHTASLHKAGDWGNHRFRFLMAAIWGLAVYVWSAGAVSAAAQDKPSLDWAPPLTVPVGERPMGLYADNRRLYVAHSGEDTIGVYFKDDLRLVQKWPVAGMPLDLLPTQKGWLATRFERDTLVRLSTRGGFVEEEITVGRGAALFSRLGADGRAFLAVADPAAGVVLDAAAGTVSERFDIQEGPMPGSISRDGTRAYVPLLADGGVLMRDMKARTVLRRVSMCSNPGGGDLSGDEQLYLIACPETDTVLIRDAMTLEPIAEIKDHIGPRPLSILSEPSGTYAFVNNGGGSSISVIDLAQKRVVHVIDVGREPLVMRLFDKQLYITNSLDGTLTRQDLPIN